MAGKWQPTADRIARGMLALGAGCAALYWYRDTWPAHDFVHDFYANASTSLISISLTVLLIDKVNTQTSISEQRERLIREMGSSDRAFAVRAAREINAHGWLKDGTLCGADFTLANLEGAELRGADLRDARLKDSNLKSTDLRETKLNGVIFDESTAEGAKFQGASLGGTSFRNTGLSRATLDAVDLSGGIDFLHSSFVQASLRGTNFRDAKLEECDFLQCDLTGADLTETKLSRANFQNAILNGVILERADLEQVIGWEHITSMDGAKIHGIRNSPAGFRDFALGKGAIG